MTVYFRILPAEGELPERVEIRLHERLLATVVPAGEDRAAVMIGGAIDLPLGTIEGLSQTVVLMRFDLVSLVLTETAQL